MLSGFESMWDIRLGRTDTAKQLISLFPVDAMSREFAPLQSGPDARKFEKHEIHEMMSERFIQPSQTEWAAT